MALLLFLVCAVIGAVVLTAATASAGRFSDLAESDRRYYSVTSAVKLLKSVIEKEEAVVVMVMNNENNGAPPEIRKEGQTVFDDIVCNGLNWEMKNVDYTFAKKQFYLNVSGKDSLKANVSLESDANCVLTVRISSGKEREQYSQTLIFTPNIDVAETTQTTPASITTVTKTVRVNWTLTEVK